MLFKMIEEGHNHYNLKDIFFMGQRIQLLAQAEIKLSPSSSPPIMKCDSFITAALLPW